ncbi:MAG: hypothetical protein DHS20C01_37310 [marine bacterium B5-7]|nr:MAG: hypothetical protein DHS20C01_37310 [marine bacterium B5-7]
MRLPFALPFNFRHINRILESVDGSQLYRQRTSLTCIDPHLLKDIGISPLAAMLEISHQGITIAADGLD